MALFMSPWSSEEADELRYLCGVVMEHFKILFSPSRGLDERRLCTLLMFSSGFPESLVVVEALRGSFCEIFFSCGPFHHFYTLNIYFSLPRTQINLSTLWKLGKSAPDQASILWCGLPAQNFWVLNHLGSFGSLLQAIFLKLKIIFGQSHPLTIKIWCWKKTQRNQFLGEFWQLLKTNKYLSDG